MEKKKPSKMRLFLLPAGGLIALLAFHFLEPGMAIGLWLFSLPLALLAYHASTRNRKALWFNLAFLFVVFALVEFGLFLLHRKEQGFLKHIRTERVYEVMDDAILGARPIPGSSRIARKFYKDSLIYEASISINENGWRVCPPCADSVSEAVLFFGNSLTFGEGVNDEETMPYQFGLANANTFCVYNFASHGWGPHQMLALTENAYIDSIVKQNVTHIVFQTLYPEHLRRMLGFYAWDRRGPRYVLNDQGLPEHRGQFNEHLFTAMLPYLSDRSYIFRRILQHPVSIGQKDKALFAQLVLRSCLLLRERYPESRFHVLLWDWSEGSDSAVFAPWRAAGIEIHHIEDILPDGDKSNLAWKISRYDKHPNAATQQRIADYLSKALR